MYFLASLALLWYSINSCFCLAFSLAFTCALLDIQGGPKRLILTFRRLSRLRDEVAVANFGSGRRRVGFTRIPKMGVATQTSLNQAAVAQIPWPTVARDSESNHEREIRESTIECVRLTIVPLHFTSVVSQEDSLSRTTLGQPAIDLVVKSRRHPSNCI